MEEEDQETPLDSASEGPGGEYEIFLKNEELLDKLKLLNYEEGFLSQGFRPIQRHYFVKSTNVGEQFYLFTSLGAWLIQKAGNTGFQMPQEFDDPNATTARIISELRAKEVPVDFSASKLRQGAGDKAIFVLDALADQALMNTDFSWQRLIPPKEEDEDVELANNDEAEENISIQEDSDDPDWAQDDDDDAVLVDLAAPTNEDQPLQAILKSDTDVLAWKQEVERVTPLLKITLRQDAKVSP